MNHAKKAKAFLRSYSGRSVKTLSALCVTNLENGRRAEGVHESSVCWLEIPPRIIDVVVQRGTVMGSVRYAGVYPACGRVEDSKEGRHAA